MDDQQPTPDEGPTTEVTLGDDGSVTATRREGEDFEQYHRTADGQVKATQRIKEVKAGETVVGLKL